MQEKLGHRLQRGDGVRREAAFQKGADVRQPLHPVLAEAVDLGERYVTECSRELAEWALAGLAQRSGARAQEAQGPPRGRGLQRGGLGDQPAEGVAEQVRRVGRTLTGERSRIRSEAAERVVVIVGAGRLELAALVVRGGVEADRRQQGRMGVKSSLLPVHPGISRTCATGSGTRIACVAKGAPTGLDGRCRNAGRQLERCGVLIGRAGPSAQPMASAHTER